ncbi:SAM-dependent methyltransferase [Marinosulfonomonas sp. PRT-SC04]|nr:SAM-dependent methyltransferase [Marinosulfonomonas sp. PRT-SC04]
MTIAQALVGTIAQALAGAVPRLRKSDVPDAANDARILLAAALNIERSRLTLVLPDQMPVAAQTAYEKSIQARILRQPVSQIIGQRNFYGRSFNVTADVLDPRPDTETLVLVALEKPFETVLDLGTGSGCILLTLLAENTAATGQGVDCSIAAIAVARGNAMSLDLTARSDFAQSDWLTDVTGQFDLIVSNPPYITQVEMATLAPEVRDWEPNIALTPGGDGLAAYRKITATARPYLAAGGRLIVEIGPTQAAAVTALFSQAGFNGITCLQDIDGRDRVVMGQ